MIIRDCPNVLCRTPLYAGKCNDECVKRWEREMGVKQKDLVEVVRCKDCKWFNKAGYDNSCEDDLNLHMGYCREWRRGTQACSFCSYGERKDNG